MADKRLAIRIITQFDGKGAKQANQEITGLNRAIGNLAKVSAAVGGTGLLLKIGRDAIQTASDIQEMQSKFNTVFGSSSGSVTSQLQQFGDAAHRSLYDLQGFAAGFQDTFVPLGFARDRAADLSVGLVKLTEDLASFNNVASSDVAANLSSALVGNHEAVRSFGIVITETTLKQELMANGWDKLTGSALEQAKVQARLNIIMRSTTDAQGDAIRTADSYANQVRGLEAAWQEFSGTLGTLALPAVTAVVTELTDLTKGAAEGLKAIQDGRAAVDDIAESSYNAAQATDTWTAHGHKLTALLENNKDLLFTMFGRGRVLDEITKVAAATGNFSGSNEELVASLEAVLGAEVAVGKDGFVYVNGLMLEQLSTLRDMSIAYNTSQSDSILLTNALHQQADASGEAGDALAYGSDLADRYGATAQKAADDSRAFGIALQQQREATIAANAALVGAFRETAEPIQALVAAHEASIQAQGRWVQTTRDNSGQVADINAQLAADLNEDQRKAYAEILNTVEEGSADWLAAWQALQGDLTASQRAELIAQRADLESAQGELGSAYTGSIEDMQAAKEAAIQANNDMIASYQQLAVEGSLALAELSPDPEAFQRTLDYAVAIGAMTQQEADLRAEAANTRLAIEQLNEAVINGDLTAEEAAEAFRLLTEGEAKSAEEAINAATNVKELGDTFGGILGPIDEVIARLNSLDGRTVRTTVEVTTNGVPSIGDFQGGNQGGGGKSSGKWAGGSVFPNHSQWVGERGPEIFRPSSPGTIIPHNQTMGSALGGDNIQIGPIYQMPGESTQELATRIGQILGKQTRQIRTAGG